MRPFAWALALLLATPPVAAAWCQSLSVAGPAVECRQACLSLDDFTAAERESRGIVPLAWRQSCIEWTLDPAGTPDLPRATLLGILEAGFDTWTDTDCGGGRRVPFEVTRVDVDALACPYVDHDRRVRNLNVITFADDWFARDNDENALALTTVHFDSASGEILGADIEIENEVRVWDECGPGGCRIRYDLANVMVHELGHFFGLAHTPDDEDATMWACSERGETLKRDLQPDDAEGWCTIYPEGSVAGCQVPRAQPPELGCTFIGDTCDPRDVESCSSGRCEDLGEGPVCTIPCADDPTVCGDGACLPAEGRRREAVCEPVPSGGCGCRAAPSPPSWPALALAFGVVVTLLRRRGRARGVGGGRRRLTR